MDIIRLNMIEIIGIMWLVVIIICAIEVYFTQIPYDKEFKKLKKEKNEYKSTN